MQNPGLGLPTTELLGEFLPYEQAPASVTVLSHRQRWPDQPLSGSIQKTVNRLEKIYILRYLVSYRQNLVTSQFSTACGTNNFNLKLHLYGNIS